VPALAFASNFLWVMVIGILGPSLPAMVADLGISYAQAGFFFTLLSLGCLIGTSLGGIGSDHLPRKALFAACVFALSVGLCVLGFMPGYFLIALLIFLLSTFGSPIGAVGQSIMLSMFPGKRERYLAFMTMFSAIGSFLAPLLVSLNFILGLSWRWTFFETAILAFIVFIAVVVVRIPPAAAAVQHTKFLTILRQRSVIICAVLIFFSVGTDLGFSYWLAEYFKTELHVSLRLSSSVVGMYLIGIIAGRLLLPIFLKRLSPRAILAGWLGLALTAILAFILVPSLTFKALLCVVYGFGIGPVFPLLIARGTSEFPQQAGAVTGVLYGALALGGMVFPLLVGSIAAHGGIARSYFLCAAVVGALLIAILGLKDFRQRAA
jgi:MFS family permease